MRENEKYYIQVALALPAMWKQNVYTYEYREKLKVGTIVSAPFGSAAKSGFVTAVVEKPDYKTKPITATHELRLNDKTLKFYDWISKYYPTTPGSHVQHFVPSFLKSIPKSVKNSSVTTAKLPKPTTLSKEQSSAYDALSKLGSSAGAVLHGITGSGKTRLYCELALKNMREGKNTLILYPEISLTSQLEQTLVEFFGDEMILTYHSKRTPAQQRRTWLKINKTQQPYICIGPRSALFLPHNNLGLVVVDEAHDGAYKQDSGSRYSGLVAAGSLARNHNAQLILGSATPPVQETELILSKGGKLVCMHDLAMGNNDSSKTFEIVDMTKSANKSQSYMLSKPLLERMRQSLANKKQVLLFLNKRGTARMLLCENCGWHGECPNCELPLTHHHDSFILQCNVCGYKKKSEISCPECKSSLTLKSPGIKAVEQDLYKLFPEATIARFDSDNKKQDTFSENYDFVKSGGADIIIGTQLLTKGLDLPLLETVGILQADSALMLPDYTSEERAFQQLTQVSGRVGRGHSSGRVVVQTYQPTSYLFKYVTTQDWHGFFAQELEKRKHSSYPPYSFVLKIWVSKNSREKAMSTSSEFVTKLKKISGLRVLGPAPSFYEKVSGKYSWQIVVMSSSRIKLSEIASELPADFYFDLDPISLL
jgi:primosomal protein N' (replication factor Y)